MSILFYRESWIFPVKFEFLIIYDFPLHSCLFYYNFFFFKNEIPEIVENSVASFHRDNRFPIQSFNFLLKTKMGDEFPLTIRVYLFPSYLLSGVNRAWKWDRDRHLVVPRMLYLGTIEDGRNALRQMPDFRATYYRRLPQKIVNRPTEYPQRKVGLIENFGKFQNVH